MKEMILRGYLVEWIDEEGCTADIFMDSKEQAQCRAEEVKRCGGKFVSVIPLYRKM